MRHVRTPLCLLAFLAALVLAAPAAHAAVVPDGFVDELVAADLAGPVNFDFLPDGRILVVEQVTARIRVVVPGAPVQPPPLGQVDDVRIQSVEDGLLGIAVDPRWPAKPYVYVHHVSASTPNIKVARLALTGTSGSPGTGASGSTRSRGATSSPTCRTTTRDTTGERCCSVPTASSTSRWATTACPAWRRTSTSCGARSCGST